MGDARHAEIRIPDPVTGRAGRPAQRYALATRGAAGPAGGRARRSCLRARRSLPLARAYRPPLAVAHSQLPLASPPRTGCRVAAGGVAAL